MSYSKIVMDKERPRKGLFQSIRTKLVVYFCLLFTVVMVIVLLAGLRGLPFTQYAGTEGQQRSEAFRSLNLVADLKKERLLRWLEERFDNAKVASSNHMMQDNLALLHTAIREFTAERTGDAELWGLVREEKSYRNLLNYIEVFRTAYGVYLEIHIADAETGTIIVSSADTYLGIDVSKEPYFTGGLSSRDTYITDIAFNPRNNHAEFQISHPIANREGEVIAIWIMVVNPEDIIRPMLHTGEGLGEKGEALLVNRDVRILTTLKHPLSDGTRAKPLEHRIKAKPAMLAARGEEGIIETEDYRGEPVLAAYRHLRVASELGWGMVVKRDEAELFAPLRKNITYSVFIGLIGILIVVVLIIFLAGGLTRPIISLSRTADKIADGDLGARASVTTSDEVGHLSITFNSMIQRIQDWHTELKEQVNARTTDLNKANKELMKEIEERKQAGKALRSERNKFQGVLNTIGEGLYIVNRDFTIEYQNEVLKESFGDREGERCCSVFFQSKEPCEFCSLREALESGKMQGTEATLPDGRIYDIVYSPFTDVDGNVKAIVLLRDITEKKTLQAEAMRAGHLASLGELAAGVAHEINNPISGIISVAEILKDQCRAQGEDDEIPTRIIKEGDRIAKIVKNLLSFARDRKEEHSPVYVQDIIKDALGLVEKHITKDGAKLNIDVPPDLPKIKARRQEIQQVFLNILSNARYALKQKFQGPHEDKVIEIRGDTIEIEGRKHVRITFYDRGIGISRNILDKICDPFFSTKPQGESRGLGLSISHGIIKNHDGRLWFESVEGESTKVVVDLPVDNGWELKG